MGLLQTLHRWIYGDPLDDELRELAIAEARTARRLVESAGSCLIPARDVDDDGPWRPLGAGAWTHDGEQAFCDETQHADIRAQCRRLSWSNEFAISGHENRISYVIGQGHRYTVAPRDDTTTLTDETKRRVQSVLDRFARANRWAALQQECVRRGDRDGEAFLRFFPVEPELGFVAIRFVEPNQVAAPKDGGPSDSFGVRTSPDDAMTVEGYWIDGALVDASEVQHRKCNVTANTKRGLPLFWPVKENLDRCEKLLRNMSVLVQTQSAIAAVRKHSQGTAAGVGAFVQSQATHTRTNPQSGRTERARRLTPGTILDAAPGVDYEFPTVGVNAAGQVGVLQAELRAIAARLVMPEFMLSADASNANYASTLVAEGPAVKMFERLQSDQIVYDLEVLDRVLDRAVALNELTQAERDSIVIETKGPTVVVHDQLQEVQANEIRLRNRIIGRRTWQLEENRDPAKEDASIEQDRERDTSVDLAQQDPPDGAERGAARQMSDGGTPQNTGKDTRDASPARQMSGESGA